MATSDRSKNAVRGKNLKAAVALFREHDTHEDGKLDATEWARVRTAPANSDADQDGVVSFREPVEAMNAPPVPRP